VADTDDGEAALHAAVGDQAEARAARWRGARQIGEGRVLDDITGQYT
jgi:hypothetical protein